MRKRPEALPGDTQRPVDQYQPDRSRAAWGLLVGWASTAFPAPCNRVDTTVALH